jgi:hypothetical protein
MLKKAIAPNNNKDSNIIKGVNQQNRSRSRRKNLFAK